LSDEGAVDRAAGSSRERGIDRVGPHLQHCARGPVDSPGANRKTPMPASRLVPRAALIALALSSVTVHAQDAAAGGMAFQQCADCHSPGASDGVGPGLKGVFGRRAGSKPGFIYSPAMAKSATVWSAATLGAYLASPRDAVPGTTMAYPGSDDAKERADLIAYLETLK
jgi:cytochrome c